MREKDRKRARRQWYLDKEQHMKWKCGFYIFPRVFWLFFIWVCIVVAGNLIHNVCPAWDARCVWGYSGIWASKYSDHLKIVCIPIVFYWLTQWLTKLQPRCEKEYDEEYGPPPPDDDGY